MKKKEKLTENIIAIELNKRKWDEEHPSKHDENTSKSKNIILNINASINLNVLSNSNAKETINLTINFT